MDVPAVPTHRPKKEPSAPSIPTTRPRKSESPIADDLDVPVIPSSRPKRRETVDSDKKDSSSVPELQPAPQIPTRRPRKINSISSESSLPAEPSPDTPTYQTVLEIYDEQSPEQPRKGQKEGSEPAAFEPADSVHPNLPIATELKENSDEPDQKDDLGHTKPESTVSDLKFESVDDIEPALEKSSETKSLEPESFSEKVSSISDVSELSPLETEKAEEEPADSPELELAKKDVDSKSPEPEEVEELKEQQPQESEEPKQLEKSQEPELEPTISVTEGSEKGETETTKQPVVSDFIEPSEPAEPTESVHITSDEPTKVSRSVDSEIAETPNPVEKVTQETPSVIPEPASSKSASPAPPSEATSGKSSEVSQSISAKSSTDSNKPVVPKKPSSKIAAFQQMLAERQQQDMGFFKPKPPVPTKRPTRKNTEDAEEQQHSVPAAAPKPMMGFPLPGMAFPGMPGMPLPGMAAFRQPETNESNEQVADVRKGRVKGPRGRKLPSTVKDKVEVNEESLGNKLDLFVAPSWSLDLRKKKPEPEEEKEFFDAVDDSNESPEPAVDETPVKEIHQEPQNDYLEKEETTEKETETDPEPQDKPVTETATEPTLEKTESIKEPVSESEPTVTNLEGDAESLTKKEFLDESD